MNTWLFNVIYDIAGRLPPRLILFFADYFGWVILVGVVIMLASRQGFTRRLWRTILTLLLSGFTAWLLTILIKLSYPLPRPAEVLGLVLPVTEASGSTFPSAHAALFMAVAYGIDRIHFNSTYVVLVVTAVVVGIARVAAGVHWPADILAGWLLGSFVGHFINILLPRTGVENRLPV